MRYLISIILVILSNVLNKSLAFPVETTDSKYDQIFDVLMMDFNSLNSNQFDNTIGHKKFKDIPETDEALQLVQGLSAEVTNTGGKLDIGSESSEAEPDILKAVSKDATRIGGLNHKSERHNSGLFKDRTHSGLSAAKPKLTLIDQISSSTPESLTGKSSTIFTSNTAPSQIPSDQVQPTQISSSSLSSESLEYSSTTSSSLTSIASHETSTLAPATTTSEIILTSEPLKVERGQNEITHVDAEQKLVSETKELTGGLVNIEGIIRKEIEKYWKMGPTQNEPEPARTKKEITSPSETIEKPKTVRETILLTITPNAPPTSSLSKGTTSTPETKPTVTTTILVTRPLTTTIPEVIETPSATRSAERPLKDTSPSDPELINFIKEKLGNDIKDIDAEKLRKLFNMLLGSKAAETTTFASTSEPIKQKEQTRYTAKSQLEDFQSLNLEVLESLGLKETLEESRNSERGSFLKNLKKIPKNVMDLVDEKYGDEYRVEHGQEAKGAKLGKHKAGKSPLKRKAAKQMKKNGKPKPKDEGQESNLEEPTSLNRILKDKSKVQPKVSQDDNSYKNLNEGKIIFGFDKQRQKIGLRKSKINLSDEDQTDEVEYYEPEKFLFHKSSVSTDTSESQKDPNSIVHNFDLPKDESNIGEKSEGSEEHISRVTKGKGESYSLNHNSKATNGTKSMLDKVLNDLGGNVKDKTSRKNNAHNDPYSIPKIPADQLKKSEAVSSIKGTTSSKNEKSSTATIKSISDSSGEKTGLKSMARFKKTPSLLFADDPDSDSAFDFTKSEANSIKLMSWSIMGAAILIATSVLLV